MSRGALIGQAAPLLQANLDTDQIMPKQFLRRVDKEGLADGVFHDLRFDAEGEPRRDFVLNQPEYLQISILLAGENFGCGSSREHAVWGLLEVGIEAIIAPSFGEIFYSNAMNNRLLLVVMAASDIRRFTADTANVQGATTDLDRRTDTNTSTDPGGAADRQAWARTATERQPNPERSITIDLEQLTVSSASRSVSFTMSARHRRMFLDRTDLVEDSLSYTKQINAFAEEYRERHPWLADSVASSMPRTGDGATRSGC